MYKSFAREICILASTGEDKDFNKVIITSVVERKSKKNYSIRYLFLSMVFYLWWLMYRYDLYKKYGGSQNV